MKIAIGPLVSYGTNWIVGQVEMLTLRGKGKHHFEVALGPAVILEDSLFFLLDGGVGSAGYRFQIPGSSMIYRAGLAWPFGVYLSVGAAF